VLVSSISASAPDNVEHAGAATWDGNKLADGTMRYAEVHWYEAHGVGAREFKIKRILEIQ